MTGFGTEKGRRQEGGQDRGWAGGVGFGVGFGGSRAGPGAGGGGGWGLGGGPGEGVWGGARAREGLELFFAKHTVFLQKFCKNFAKKLRKFCTKFCIWAGRGSSRVAKILHLGTGGPARFGNWGGGSSRVANILDSQASSNVGRHNSSVFLL